MSHNASAAIKVVFPFPRATCMTPSLTRRRPSSTHRQPHRFARTHSCQSASVNFLPVSSPTRVSVATKSSSLSTDSQSITRSERSRSARKRRAAAWIHRPASLPSRMASTSAKVRISAFTILSRRQVMRAPPQIRPKVTPPYICGLRFAYVDLPWRFWWHTRHKLARLSQLYVRSGAIDLGTTWCTSSATAPQSMHHGDDLRWMRRIRPHLVCGPVLIWASLTCLHLNAVGNPASCLNLTGSAPRMH